MSDAAAALRGATWMAGAFAASSAIEIVPAGALFFTALSGGVSASMLVMTAAGLAAVCALARVGIYVLALRGLSRGAPRVPWIAVVLVALLALAAYPLSAAASYGTTMVLARWGSEALAEYAMGSTYVHLGAGLAQIAITAGALIAAAVMWSRRIAAPSGDVRSSG